MCFSWNCLPLASPGTHLRWLFAGGSDDDGGCGFGTTSILTEPAVAPRFSQGYPPYGVKLEPRPSLPFL